MKIYTILLSALILIACIVAITPVSGITPVSDSWMPKAAMHQARAGLGTVTVGDKIYAIGGSLGVNMIGGLSNNEEYDPATDNWAIKTSMPTPRAFFAIAAYRDLIYCIGGITGMQSYTEPALNGLVGQVHVGTNAFEVYNTTSGIWESKKSAPNGIGFCTTQVINDSIYIFQVGDTFVYNIGNETWTTKTRIPIDYMEFGLVSTVFNDKIIVSARSRDPVLYTYNHATDNWTASTPCEFYSILGIAATAGVKAPKLVYVFGYAYPEGRAELLTKAYYMENDSWTEGTPMLNVRQYFGVANINDLIYTIGGITFQEFRGIQSGLNDLYTPIGYSTPPQINFSVKQNQSYNQSNVSLNITFDKPISWSGYSLDGQNNVTFTNNLSLVDLSNGAHNLTVYANDTYGSMNASETIYFTINAPSSFPIELAIIGVPVIVIILVTLALYRKKENKYRKRPLS